ncbi:Sensor kinase CckA [bacterium HR36]|nr:Sensor kinase CckA [bacterium HR36]
MTVSSIEPVQCREGNNLLGETLPQRLAAALCCGAEADLVFIGRLEPQGQLHEEARTFSEAGTRYDWSSGPRVSRLITRLENAATTQGTSSLNPSAASDGYPGPLLFISQSLGDGRKRVALLLRLPEKPPFGPREHRLTETLIGLLRQNASSDDVPLLLHVRLLTQIAQVSGSSPDLGYSLQFALRELARHCPGCLASVWLVQGAEGTVLELAACSDTPWNASRPGPSMQSGSTPSTVLSWGLTFALRDSPFAPVVERRQVIYLERLAEQPWELLRHWASQGFHACAAVPLFVGQEKVGILILLSRRLAGLTQEQVHLAATIGELLGPIIACHRLNERLSQAYAQLQKAQQQLANAEKMRALGELASGMAHDFNNALCGTLGFLELALKDPQLPPPVEELLRMARTCALDAAATVRRVQDFARWDRGLQNAELVQVNDLVRHVVELTRPRWHNAARADSRIIEVALDLQAQVPIMGNPAELREVLTNLVLNAVDAMPRGGRIHIATTNDTNNVWLTVSDTGVGMAPEIQQRIFEPFFTTKKERGTGLGLSISYAIIQRHGGQISVSSELGKGSTFTIRLPAVRNAPASEQSAGHPPAQTLPRALRVLVIDDEPHVLSFLRQCLLHLGHHPDTESDPEQALEQFRRQPYDLVITDLGMPKLDGKQVAARIHELAPEVPVILLTGWGEQYQHSQECPPSVRQVLAKPVTVEQLAQVLRSG